MTQTDADLDAQPGEITNDPYLHALTKIETGIDGIQQQVSELVAAVNARLRWVERGQMLWATGAAAVGVIAAFIFRH